MLFGTSWTKKLSSTLQKLDSSQNPEQICRVIIEYANRRNERIGALVASRQGRVRRELKIVPSLAVELPLAVLEELARSRDVKYIWNDAEVKTMLNYTVPEVGSLLAQEAGYTGKDTVAAIIDTGIGLHPDLTTPDNRIIGWNDLVNEQTSPYDDNGHGTHIAGIIAGNGYSSQGKYKGMAPEAELVGVKVLDKNGSGNISDVISGIEWCIDHQTEYRIKALNLSLGATADESYRDDPLCRATTAAWLSRITVCAAAGNSGPESGTISTPGINPTIITVGNLDDGRTLAPEDDSLNDSSSRGPTIDNLVKPDFLAPGTKITSLRPNKGYQEMTGTSMSTAVATGAALQLGQKWPDKKPDEIKKILMDNARNLDLAPNLQGSGTLDLSPIFSQEKGSPESQSQNVIIKNKLSPITVIALLIILYLVIER